MATGRSWWRSPHAAWWLAGTFAAAGLATWLAFPPQQVEAMMGETGSVERLTAACYAACALLIWLLRDRRDDLRSTAATSLLMFAFCARELDWHKAFTGTSMLRLSWYAGPASMGAKVLAAGVLLLVLAALFWLVRRHAGSIWRGWRRREPVAVTVVVFLIVLAVAKSLDRSVSLLVFDAGIDVPLNWVALRSALEEWLELALSMLVVLALWQRRATIAACRSART
jgi:hypothetical protein